MRASEPQRTWQISQVQQLVGLQRRDIQRACYTGEGGVGILSPQDSSWGRRRYDVEDLAKLFLVRQYKSRGHSLPEIAKMLEEEQNRGQGCLSLLETQAQRLYEQHCDTLDQLVRAEALLRAASQPDGAGTARLVEELADWAGCTDPAALLETLEQAAHCMRTGAAPDAPQVRDALIGAAAALGHDASNLETPSWQLCARNRADAQTTDGKPDAPNGSCSPMPSDPLKAFLDLPGVDLALELWLGAGSFEFLCKATSCIDGSSGT